MTNFERGIANAIKVYDAGVKGTVCPYFPGTRVSDITKVYTEGRLDALAELDEAHERGDLIVAFDVYERFGSPKAMADFAATRASKRAKWPTPR